jgi:hypothetical protein
MRLVILALSMFVAQSAYAIGSFKGFGIMKSAHESVTNSDTYQDDDELIGSFASNTTWYFTMDLHFVSASATPDVKFKYVEPVVGSTITAHCVGSDATPPGTTTLHSEYMSFGQEIVLALSAGVNGDLQCSGTMEVKTGGVFKVQWAQNTANETPTTFMRGSSYTLRRLK